MMKRPPGLWCLLIIATFWLCVQDVDSLRATALILGKSPSTTTTTEATQEIDSQDGVTEVSGSEDSPNVTKPILTGIPQIDYIWDPNLPRELNGYNLSEYPFYDRVPEDINFKCDGLHDGFYASVPHKCQVYHHCLFGIRYDFLCANYTAFDQKTFICHFVSEVDCLNSKKFWHRNDALYEAATTTTVKPAVVTTPPAPSVPITPILNRRPTATGPGGGLRPRRPLRRRPQYDYYDDEYEDEEYEERRLRKRPRYRPRPVYEDDYEDYEEETYSKRRPSRRRPYDRRGDTRRNKEERRRYEDDEYAEADVDSEDDRREDKRDEETRRRPSNRNRSRPGKRRPADDEDYDRRSERPKKRTRRPVDDEDDYEDVPPRRGGSERKKNKNREVERDVDVDDRPKKNNKNEERNTRNEGRNNRNEERNRNADEKPKSKPETKVKPDVTTEEPPLTKAPLSVYERKRPTKIRPPVPLSEQSKYTPKTTTSTALVDEDYYDDYEEEEVVKEIKRQPERRPIKEPPKRMFGLKKAAEYEDEEPIRRTTKRPQNNSKDRRVGSGTKRRPVVEQYDDYEDKPSSSKSTPEEPQTTTTKEPVKEKHEPIIKVVKRPFLPSRGGNPYTPRGLTPIGLKSVDESLVKEEQRIDTPKPLESSVVEENQRVQPHTLSDEIAKPSKPVLKQRNKFTEDDFKPITNRPVSRINIVKLTTTTSTTTEKSIQKNPLDLDENEYDVTLNDALNPTIPNLPIRNFPTGFSSANDYNYNTVQRSRYVADPTLNQASSDYVYRIEPLQSRYVPLYQSYRQTPRQHPQAYYAGY